ncbi:IS21 family transposase [Paenibacillus sp. WQ 127069]|uniref:IS21 family transposase n=1 Tax=Paenibacillus baimaensis TaxID=2982185 RepID=A0ABT2UQI5_9BACL|nr:IS21 family transposase [Paenibacillus sp. WQ 127069]MCU6796807.1 IS21 family transposase [Paenibacillus sp. WQ 127069]
MDWGHFRVDWNQTKKQLYAFVMVLGYSRMLYVEYTEDEKVETLIGCHERTMTYFGGITRTCLYDNMKTVVIGQDEQGEVIVIWNERFAQFAAHHGFILRRCKPYRPRTKGKVENGIGYVRKNFWPRVQSITGLHDLNEQVRLWLDTVANCSVHGTTHEIPTERWTDEKLKPGNLFPFQAAERHPRKVLATPWFLTRAIATPFRLFTWDNMYTIRMRKTACSTCTTKKENSSPTMKRQAECIKS